MSDAKYNTNTYGCTTERTTESTTRELLDIVREEQKRKNLSEADVREIIRQWDNKRDTPEKIARSMPIEAKMILKGVMSGLKRISNRQNAYGDERLRAAIFIEQLCQATDVMSTLLEQFAEASQDHELKTIAQEMTTTLSERSRRTMDWIMRQPHVPPPVEANAVGRQ